jgi:hypothetical protein
MGKDNIPINHSSHLCSTEATRYKTTAVPIHDDVTSMILAVAKLSAPRGAPPRSRSLLARQWSVHRRTGMTLSHPALPPVSRTRFRTAHRCGLPALRTGPALKPEADTPGMQTQHSPTAPLNGLELVRTDPGPLSVTRPTPLKFSLTSETIRYSRDKRQSHSATVSASPPCRRY